jgi:hypothetical protein
MTTDNRLIGERNTLAVLSQLHRFGWLTSRMIATLVWASAKQAPAMARRAVKSLTDDKLILRRPLPEGGDCYTLSAAGARSLNDTVGLVATSGASLPLGNTVHRACANWYVIRHINEGTTVWTEHEIQTGRAPLVSVDGKIPDALVDTPYGLIWVEVENAWKNRSERGAVVRFSSRHLPSGDRMSELAPGHYLFRMAIVGTNADALRAMCRSFADAHVLGNISESQAADVELVLLPVDKSLVAAESVTGSLWYDALSPMLST